MLRWPSYNRFHRYVPLYSCVLFPFSFAFTTVLFYFFPAGFLGLPLIHPYLETTDPRQSVNFAIVGATALDDEFFQARNIHIPYTNISLGIQLGWFKDKLLSLCPTFSSKRISSSFFFWKNIFLLLRRVWKMIILFKYVVEDMDNHDWTRALVWL